MTLAERAADLLRQNDRGGFTVPSPKLYPHQWAWDSAFAAIGFAHVDHDRAVRELEILMDGQWDDGRVPHIRFHTPTKDYFPGPDFWGTEKRAKPSSSITQPPVWATAARRVLELGGNPERIQALLPAMDRSHEFFARHRDPLGWNLVAVVHPWESGLDNSPAWDEPLQDVDPTLAGEFRRVDKERVENPKQRPTDEQYKRYASLVKQILAADFGPGPFAVYDPLMSTLLARSIDDLNWMIAELSSPLAPRDSQPIKTGLMERLWTGEYFGFYDARKNREIQVDVLAAHSPLMLDVPVRAQLVERLGRDYSTVWPLPSTSPVASQFDPQCYWRGPVWINMNWLFAPYVPGLAARTLELIEREGFWEYYHPDTGKPLGGPDFTWTAALALDLMKQGAGVPAP